MGGRHEDGLWSRVPLLDRFKGPLYDLSCKTLTCYLSFISIRALLSGFAVLLFGRTSLRCLAAAWNAFYFVNTMAWHNIRLLKQKYFLEICCNIYPSVYGYVAHLKISCNIETTATDNRWRWMHCQSCLLYLASPCLLIFLLIFPFSEGGYKGQQRSLSTAGW